MQPLTLSISLYSSLVYCYYIIVGILISSILSLFLCFSLILCFSLFLYLNPFYLSLYLFFPLFFLYSFIMHIKINKSIFVHNLFLFISLSDKETQRNKFILCPIKRLSCKFAFVIIGVFNPFLFLFHFFSCYFQMLI